MTANKVISLLEELADPIKAEHSKRFFKSGPGEYAEGDIFYGITVPKQRGIAKKFKNMELEQVQILIEYPVHEVRLTAVMLLVYKIEKAPQNEIDEVAEFYLQNLKYVNNWDIIDSSCRFILAKHLEHRERHLLYDLARSKDLWEKRISIITCYYFIKQGDFIDALAISEILLEDDHDLIHKAVGWMLREVGNMDQQAEEDFLKKNSRYLAMPRTMLRYAIEKFDEPIRKKYLKGEI
jgi:3-methyladenine DNA glycosylase AlkD